MYTYNRHAIADIYIIYINRHPDVNGGRGGLNDTVNQRQRLNDICIGYTSVPVCRCFAPCRRSYILSSVFYLRRPLKLVINVVRAYFLLLPFITVARQNVRVLVSICFFVQQTSFPYRTRIRFGENSGHAPPPTKWSLVFNGKNILTWYGTKPSFVCSKKKYVMNLFRLLEFRKPSIYNLMLDRFDL